MAARKTSRRSAAASRASTGPEAQWGGLADGARVVVDTAPIVYWLEDHAFAELFAGMFVAHAEGRLWITISTITLAEVLAGPFKKGADALAKRYETALSELDLEPVSRAIAVSASRLRARYGLKLPDALQLATALETGADALVTHDRDFARVEGLRILRGAPTREEAPRS